MVVIRILVYEGDEEWVSKTLKLRAIKEELSLPTGSIKEGFVAPYGPTSWDY